MVLAGQPSPWPLWESDRVLPSNEKLQADQDWELSAAALQAAVARAKEAETNVRDWRLWASQRADYTNMLWAAHREVTSLKASTAASAAELTTITHG